MKIGEGYAFTVGYHGSDEYVYIVDHVSTDGRVALQVCGVKEDSNFETYGDSPFQWIYIGIADFYRMADQNFYSLIHGKSYMEEVERFRS
jgi:hypothetical protein